MPNRKAQPSSVPAPGQDVNKHKKELCEAISQRLQELETQSDRQERAKLYAELGGFCRATRIFPGLHMYGRALHMYWKSLQEVRAPRSLGKLIGLLVNLYGEVGIQEAQKLVGAINFDAVEFEQMPIEQWLAQKKDAIKRRQEKEAQESQESSLKQIVGESQSILEVCKQINACALEPVNVLISGDTGTGKERVARALHACSPRKGRPFITLNCGGIPDELLESELFGYEEGAFTGAAKGGKVGKFELAQGGTLFLDEIENLSPRGQATILRAIAEKEIDRLGGTKSIKVDVRFISASNADLYQAVRDKLFREDLYYRLKQVEIPLEPLDHRRAADLPRLAKHFAEDPELTPYDIWRWLWRHQAKARPGNVREFQNEVKLAVMRKELYHQGNFPFEDWFLFFRGPDEFDRIIGPQLYTPKDIEKADRSIARDLCKRRGNTPKLISQKDLAKLFEMSESRFSRYLAGDGNRRRTHKQ